MPSAQFRPSRPGHRRAVLGQSVRRRPAGRGVAPVVRLRKRKATDMLRQPIATLAGACSSGRWPGRRRCCVDTAFMAYDACSPFLTAPGVDRAGGQAGDLGVPQVAAEGRHGVDFRTARGGRMGGGREVRPVPHAADGAGRARRAARRWTTISARCQETAAATSAASATLFAKAGATIENCTRADRRQPAAARTT